MLNNERTQPDPDHLAEARASKRRVRRVLQAMIDEHLAVDPLMLDAALEESLFADLPWRDPSPSGEFEAIQA
jgi:hypothetical protein